MQLLCKRPSFIAYILAVNFCLAVSGPFLKWRKRAEQCKLTEENIYDETTAYSLTECLIICGHTDDCFGISWHSETGSCLGTIDHLGESTDFVEIASGWETYTYVPYGVVLVTSESVIIDTYSKALQACDANGFNLASPEDLLLTSSFGFDLCECGWMSDEHIGTIDSYACSNVEGPILAHCVGDVDDAGAWCKV